MIDVVCCLWGNWPSGEGWGPEYVRRLRNSVRRNFSRPHRFTCLTDQPHEIAAGIRTRPLTAPTRLGVLPKLSVYDPAHEWEERVIVLDLDTVIVGSLDEMFSYQGRFCVRKAYHPKALREFRGVGGDALSFAPGFGAEELWKPLTERTSYFEANSRRGDERQVYSDWLRKRGVPVDFWQDLFPGQYLSWKMSIKKAGLSAPPEGTTMVSFHGTPRPHEVRHRLEFVKEHWR
jgi:hypothetical protein